MKAVEERGNLRACTDLKKQLVFIQKILLLQNKIHIFFFAIVAIVIFQPIISSVDYFWSSDVLSDITNTDWMLSTEQGTPASCQLFVWQQHLKQFGNLPACSAGVGWSYVETCRRMINMTLRSAPRACQTPPAPSHPSPPQLSTLPPFHSLRLPSACRRVSVSPSPGLSLSVYYSIIYWHECCMSK